MGKINCTCCDIIIKCLKESDWDMDDGKGDEEKCLKLKIEKQEQEKKK
jgi:hypothetical protein